MGSTPKVNREMLAWAAGFFDGDGCVCKTYDQRGKLGPYKAVQVNIGQVDDKAILEKFNKVTLGIGKVYGPYPIGKKRERRNYQYEANSFEKVQAIAAMLWPWLSSVKRTKFVKILKEMK